MYNDLPFKEMERVLEQAAAETNHSDCDCILISVLSHGELGILYASDSAYKPDILWSLFDAEQCPTLAGMNKRLKNWPISDICILAVYTFEPYS